MIDEMRAIRKRVICLATAVVLALCLAMTGCSDSAASASASKQANKPDIDLTQLSSTMVYSEVYNMVTDPSAYLGKTVRAKGAAASAQDGKNVYHAVIIADATQCCAQGLEYVLMGNDAYPVDGREVCVEGVFTTYTEGNNTYCTLRSARFVS